MVNSARLDISAVPGTACWGCCLIFNNCSEDIQDWSGADACQTSALGTPDCKLSNLMKGRIKDLCESCLAVLGSCCTCQQRLLCDHQCIRLRIIDLVCLCSCCTSGLLMASVQLKSQKDQTQKHHALHAAAAVTSMLHPFTIHTSVLAIKYLLNAQADLELYQHVSSSGAPPYFALSWLITWFSHNVPALEQITRLFDLFMASHPLMPLYVAVIAMRVRRLSTSLSCLSLCILSPSYGYWACASSLAAWQ